MSRPFSDTLVQRLAAARRVAVLTGAGISAESGIPTFRDADGLWQKFRPEELANVEAFLRNPVLVQEWYAHRRRIARETAPNAGHHALARLQGLVDDLTLITQNVDDLHRRAGSDDVVELHGNITRTYCIDCRAPAPDADVDAAAGGEPARCRACGGYLRPDVVWFGELLPAAAMRRAEQAAAAADVFLSIGTSAVVYPAAGLPVAAGEHGAYVAEINVEPSAIAPYLHETVLGRAGTVLPQLVDAVAAARGSANPSR